MASSKSGSEDQTHPPASAGSSSQAPVPPAPTVGNSTTANRTHTDPPAVLTHISDSAATHTDTAFHEYLDDFCTACIDDILIYSEDTKNHTKHVGLILQRLREAGLQVDVQKCSFGVTEVKYLGLITTTKGVQMDMEKWGFEYDRVILSKNALEKQEKERNGGKKDEDKKAEDKKDGDKKDDGKKDEDKKDKAKKEKTKKGKK